MLKDTNKEVKKGAEENLATRNGMTFYKKYLASGRKFNRKDWERCNECFQRNNKRKCSN
jgi:hypothetical protein